MSTLKYFNWKLPPCKDKTHFPPSMRVYPHGITEYKCPRCGHITIISKPHIKLFKAASQW